MESRITEPKENPKRLRNCCPHCHSFNYLRILKNSKEKGSGIKVSHHYVCRNCEKTFMYLAKIEAKDINITKKIVDQFAKFQKNRKVCPKCGSVEHKRTGTNEGKHNVFQCIKCGAMYSVLKKPMPN